MKMNDDWFRVRTSIAKEFVERAKFLKLKGKKRDTAALEFFLGAAAAFDATQQMRLRDGMIKISTLLIAIRGYAEVERMANESAPIPKAGA